MKATCKSFSIATSAASSATIVFPTHVALKEAVHGLGALHVIDDFLERGPLSFSQPERQNLRADSRMRSSTFTTTSFDSRMAERRRSKTPS
jgi:hypothetical protein